ncbi:hypothetical protein NY406_05905 [Chlorobaculum sp. MV4-Y]|jgi:hypothetical protein|nr:hypothetical protein [Chlorobaculum sp. MV4-Y]UWX56792.1 hypothetical protein NY406_05905 [Chlorobaculum sp. MV4-Y]
MLEDVLLINDQHKSAAKAIFDHVPDDLELLERQRDRAESSS